jgi:ubiquinone/menaquinone biosynthesis C-methylase UbiE
VGDAEANRRVFDSVADSYVDVALKPAERAVLARLGADLKEFEMLDLGVGAGRTGYTFAPLVRRYVGLDYSPQMLKRAGKLLGERAGVELVLGNARDLPMAASSFDFVLFSFNGIDAVGHEDRLRILAEVHRVLKPDGRFLFSSHQLGTLPLPTKKARSERFKDSRAYELFARLRDVRYGRRIRAVNESLDLEAARRRGWTTVEGIGHDFQLTDYYVDPEYQVRQLREVGFEVISIYDTSGTEVGLPFRGKDPWLDYFCKPIGAGA